MAITSTVTVQVTGKHITSTVTVQVTGRQITSTVTVQVTDRQNNHQYEMKTQRQYYYNFCLLTKVPSTLRGKYGRAIFDFTGERYVYQ